MFRRTQRALFPRLRGCCRAVQPRRVNPEGPCPDGPESQLSFQFVSSVAIQFDRPTHTRPVRRQALRVCALGGCPGAILYLAIRRARLLTGRHRNRPYNLSLPSRFNSIDQHIPGLSGDRPSGWVRTENDLSDARHCGDQEWSPSHRPMTREGGRPRPPECSMWRRSFVIAVSVGAFRTPYHLSSVPPAALAADSFFFFSSSFLRRV